MLQFVSEIVAHGKRHFVLIFECSPAVYVSGEDCPRGAGSELYVFLSDVGLTRFMVFFWSLIFVKARSSRATCRIAQCVFQGSLPALFFFGFR